MNQRLAIKTCNRFRSPLHLHGHVTLSSFLPFVLLALLGACGHTGGSSSGDGPVGQASPEPTSQGPTGGSQKGIKNGPQPLRGGSLVLDGHALGDVREEAVVVPLPDEKTRSRCEAVYRLALPEEAESAHASNPFALASGKASWSEALAFATTDLGFLQLRPSAFRTLSADIRFDGRSSSKIECTFPVKAQGMTAAFDAYPPPKATFGLDDGSYAGVERRVLGGLAWRRNSVGGSVFKDEISLQWLLVPAARATTEVGFFSVESKSVFEGLASGTCVARAVQVASEKDFKGASLWAIPTEESCSKFPLFVTAKAAPPADAPVARLADGRIDPASGWAYDDTGVLRPEIMIPFDPTGVRTFTCELPGERLRCGETLVRDMTRVLEASVAKGQPLFVRFASKTATGQTIIASGSISPEGKVTILEVRPSTPADAISLVLQ